MPHAIHTIDPDYDTIIVLTHPCKDFAPWDPTAEILEHASPELQWEPEAKLIVRLDDDKDNDWERILKSETTQKKGKKGKKGEIAREDNGYDEITTAVAVTTERSHDAEHALSEDIDMTGPIEEEIVHYRVSSRHLTLASPLLPIKTTLPGIGPILLGRIFDYVLQPSLPLFLRHELWLSTGMRAMDHAVECMYHPSSTEVPWKALSIWAVGELFECLLKARDSHPYDEIVTIRLMLAAYASSGLKGENLEGGMGLSHSLGHALGSPYGIPHGITSCMTLGKVVKLKAHESMGSAKQICRLLPATGGRSTGDDVRDAHEVGDRIIALVKSLDLDVSTLSARGVSKDQTFTIAQRALGGAKEGPMFDQVRELVQTLF